MNASFDRQLHATNEIVCFFGFRPGNQCSVWTQTLVSELVFRDNACKRDAIDLDYSRSMCAQQPSFPFQCTNWGPINRRSCGHMWTYVDMLCWAANIWRTTTSVQFQEVCFCNMLQLENLESDMYPRHAFEEML